MIHLKGRGGLYFRFFVNFVVKSASRVKREKDELNICKQTSDGIARKRERDGKCKKAG